MTQREVLQRRVDVMEMERTHAAVVATQKARPTGLGDERLLHDTPPTGHGFGPAFQASEPTLRSSLELGDSMTRTLENHARAGPPHATAAKGLMSRDPKLGQPMAHGAR
jgi:hypothetical protein